MRRSKHNFFKLTANRTGRLGDPVLYNQAKFSAPSKPVAGVSMLELLVTLLLVAILMAATVPSFKNTVARSRLNQTQQGLIDSLTLARSEAIKRGQPVTVCASTDQENCSTDPVAWNTGWLVLAAANAAGEPVAETDPEALLLTQTTGARVQLITQTDRIAFRADGSTQQTLQLVICSTENEALLENNRIFVNFAGRHLKDTATDLCQ